MQSCKIDSEDSPCNEIKLATLYTNGEIIVLVTDILHDYVHSVVVHACKHGWNKHLGKSSDWSVDYFRTNFKLYSGSVTLRN